MWLLFPCMPEVKGNQLYLYELLPSGGEGNEPARWCEWLLVRRSSLQTLRSCEVHFYLAV